MPLQYSTTLTTYMTSNTCGILCFLFYILFCKDLEMMGSGKIHTASGTSDIIEWFLTSSAHPYIDTYMFCLYVISTLNQLLE
jgi:hypothetical protein